MSRPPRFDYSLGLRAIEYAVAAGERAPTNVQLAALMGAKSATAGATCIASLEERGLIVVHRFHHGRTITLTRTGASTAPPPNPQPRRERPKRNSHCFVPQRVTEAPSPVFRDPCPRCGIRADVGCAHGWVP